jgi:hypothetical protein
MDIRIYFQKVREAENTIAGQYAVISSLETSDGGKPGRLSEVDRTTAARLIVENRARLATDEETQRYRDEANAIREAAEQAALASRVHVTLVNDPDLRPSRRKG